MKVAKRTCDEIWYISFPVKLELEPNFLKNLSKLLGALELFNSYTLELTCLLTQYTHSQKILFDQ